MTQGARLVLSVYYDKKVYAMLCRIAPDLMDEYLHGMLEELVRKRYIDLEPLSVTLGSSGTRFEPRSIDRHNLLFSLLVAPRADPCKRVEPEYYKHIAADFLEMPLHELEPYIGRWREAVQVQGLFSFVPDVLEGIWHMSDSNGAKVCFEAADEFNRHPEDPVYAFSIVLSKLLPTILSKQEMIRKSSWIYEGPRRAVVYSEKPSERNLEVAVEHRGDGFLHRPQLLVRNWCNRYE